MERTGSPQWLQATKGRLSQSGLLTSEGPPRLQGSARLALWSSTCTAGGSSCVGGCARSDAAVGALPSSQRRPAPKGAIRRICANL